MKPLTKTPIGRTGFGRHERASAGVEFAITLPFILLLLTATIDFGSAIWRYAAVETAAHEAGILVGNSDASFASIETIVEQSSWLPSDELNVTISEVCQCGNGASQTCPANCSPGVEARTYAQISVTTSFDSFLPLPKPFLLNNISSQSVLRLQ